MPLNTWSDIEKVVGTLHFLTALDKLVPLDESWKRFTQHLITVSRDENAGNLTVRDILYKGHLAPLTKDMVTKV